MNGCDQLFHAVEALFIPDLVHEKDFQVLQFVRHDPNYAFPWTALYDFKLPAELAGQPVPPVCLGTRDSGRAGCRRFCRGLTDS